MDGLHVLIGEVDLIFWMRFHSLPEFSDATTGKTIEGYDLPKRAIIKADL